MTQNPHKTLMSALSKFKKHKLEDLSKAALMDRVDSKFMLPTVLLLDIFNQMRHHYTLLDLKDNSVFKYNNTYFDTPDLNFYTDHHNGKLNRFKVRHRRYVDSNINFLEVKFKNNKKRTIKTRIPAKDCPDASLKDAQSFLHTCGVPNVSSLKAVQKGGYHRIALANEAAGERLTFDLGLYFNNGKNSNDQHLQEYVIAELKQGEFNRNSPFYKLMRHYGIRPTPFSKYCMGMYFTGDGKIKGNRFLPIARNIHMTETPIKQTYWDFT